MKKILVVSALAGLITACGYDEPAQPPPQTLTGSITIVEPLEGARVAAGQPVTLRFEVDPGDRGDHVHITTGGETDVVQMLSGTHEVGPFESGSHTINLMVVDSSHVPTGLESNISVTAE